MDEPRYTVQPVTQLRFLIMGPRRECGGFHRTAKEARLAADRLNAPPPRSK